MFLTRIIGLMILVVSPGLPSILSEKCDSCVRVNQICHNLTYLFDLNADFRQTVVISQVEIMRSDNILYFSFEPDINDAEYNKIGFVNLDNINVTGVLSADRQIFNFRTFDIDQDRNQMYLGGSDGIYKLDKNVNKLTQFSTRGDTILSLFYKNTLYFVRDGEYVITRKDGVNFQPLPMSKPVEKFVITKNNVMVFTSPYGLLAAKNEIEVLLSANPFFRGLVLDLDDNVHTWLIDGIYKVVLEKNITESTLVKVVELDNVGAITFDNNNNLVVTADKSLFKLIPVAADAKC